MGKGFSKFLKLVVLAGALPFVYGCGSGGVSSLASFLFGSTGIGGGIALLGGAAADATLGGAEVATLVNPEPASMLLIGGGLAAMTYFSSRKK
ncbi:MAG: PEP-CTERM sorting domain-containing protein [Candidatus Omnitrophica bacterium]|nr:PEP-CTERM sorting domain-containing protein [Candidatus Omnitrophota bacterium]